MSNSINTNYGATIALESLNATNAALQTTQNAISTGLKISTAKDNGAIWAIAEKQKSQASSLDTVKDSLNNGKSVLDTTVSTGGQLSDILTQLKAQALAASDAGITDDSRAQYQANFAKLAQTYANVVASATFNGKNLIDGNTTSSLSALGSADGSVTVKSDHADLSANTLFSGVTALSITAGTGTGASPYSADAVSNVTTANTAWTGTNGAANAAADLTKISAALNTVTNALAGFGADSTAFDNQLTSVSNLQDSLTTGVGNLVDADVAKESANLTALQTKQQLGVQALSIANSSSSTLLSLFRG